jgi:hypothetical protein
MGGASKFADVNPNHHNSGSVTAPLDTLRILYTLMYIAYDPSLGCGPASDISEKSSDGRGSSSISLRRNGTDQFLRDSQGVAPRLEVYVEYIYAPGSEELKGWCFVFQAVDEVHFSMDAALVKLFIRLRAQMSKRGAKMPFDVKGICPFLSAEDWISHGISGYAKERFWDSDDATVALSMELTDDDNPARCSKVFTFEYSRRLIEEVMNVDPKYRVDYFAMPEAQAREIARMEGVEVDESQNEDGNTQDYFRRYAATDSPSGTEDGDIASIDGQSVSRRGAGTEVASFSKVPLVFPEGAAYVHIQRRAPWQFFGYNCMSAPRSDPESIGGGGAAAGLLDSVGEESVQFMPSSGHNASNKRSDRMNIDNAAKRVSPVQNAIQYFTKLKQRCIQEVKEERRQAAARQAGRLGLGVGHGLRLFSSSPGSSSQGSSSSSSSSQGSDAPPKAAPPPPPPSGYGNMSEDEVEGMRRYYRELCSDESKAVINTVLNADNECPATVVAHQFVQKMVNENPNQSLIRPSLFLIDHELTTFGNFVAYDMFVFDHLYTLTALHQELHFLQISSLQAFDIASKDRMHVIFSGIPASGKSHIMKVQAEDLSIPNPEDPSREGLVLSISVQTKRAMTTDENLNGHKIWIDEANANLVGKGDDGTGVQEMKEILTTGKLTTEQCFYDHETGKRVNMKTVSYRMCQHMCGTNVPFWEIKVATEAIYTRFAKFTIPIRDIEGKDPTESGYRIQRLDAAPDMTSKFQQMWHIRQGISAYIYVLIRCKAIPPIDITIVEKLMPIIGMYLKSIGISIHIRDNARLHLHPQAVTVYHAINMVFFTDRHFKEGTPWNLDQVLACVPYLTCTREQFWFGFSQMFQTIVNPFMDNIMDAMYAIIKAEETEDQYSVHFEHGRQTREPNYNYYLLNVTAHRAQDESVFAAAAKVISRRIVTSGGLQLNEGNVLDFLKWMEGQWIEAPFQLTPIPTASTGGGQPAARALDEITSTHMIPVIKEIRNGSRVGLEISSFFVEEKRTRKYLEILEMCIRKTMEPLPTGQTPRRIVLGETLRMEGVSFRKAWSKLNRERGLPPHPLDSGQAQAPMVDGRLRKRQKERYQQQPNFFHCIVEGPEIDPKTNAPRTAHVRIANDKCIPRSLRFMLIMHEVEKAETGEQKAAAAIAAAKAFQEGDDEYDVEETVSAETLDKDVFERWCQKIGFNPADMKKDTKLNVAYMGRGEYPYNFQEHGYGASKRNTRPRADDEDEGPRGTPRMDSTDIPRSPAAGIVGEVHDLSEADEDDDDEVTFVDDASGEDDDEEEGDEL